MRILVVEDNLELADVMGLGLEDEGYVADLCFTGKTGLEKALANEYDVVILDVMLPDMDGFQVLDGMRAAGRTSPVLFLTARDSGEDRIRGLDAGADDYVLKPFVWEEVLARLRVILRRAPAAADGVLRVGPLELDPATRELRCAGETIPVNGREFEAVYVLIREPGRVFTRTEIGARIYSDEHGDTDPVVDVLLNRVRHKLAARQGAPEIRSVPGAGYALCHEQAA